MKNHTITINYASENKSIIQEATDACLDKAYELLSDILDDLVNQIKNNYNTFANILYDYNVKYDYSIIENNVEYIRNALIDIIDNNISHLDLIYLSSINIDYTLTNKDSIILIDNLRISNCIFDDCQNI